MGVIEVINVIGLSVFTLWSIKGFIVYFTWNVEDTFRDFAGFTMLPFGIQENCQQYMMDRTFSLYFDPKEKKFMMMTHVALALIWGVCLFIQFVPQVRHHALWLHRACGKVFMITYIAPLPFLVWISWTAKLNPVLAFVQVILGPLSGYFALNGYYEIKRGDLASHRSSMIMMSAGLFFLLVQRVLVPVFQFISIHLAPIFGGLLVIPSSLQPEQYIAYAYGLTSVFALFLCYGVAVFNAYIQPQQRAFEEKSKLLIQHSKLRLDG